MAVVLPDGTEISDEEYAAMVAQAGGTGIPTQGTVLGTNYNYVPSASGFGGGLNLGWDQTPGFGVGINFDPTAGLENAFIGNYDVSGQGQASIGDSTSPDATLGLTAGFEGTGLNAPDPYIQAAVTDVIPGLNAYTGTNVPSQISYSAGNLEDQGYSLGLNKFSGGPTEADFTMGLTPGVNLNLGTAQGGNVGVTASGDWGDIGKTARQLWGGVKDAFGNIISPAGASDEVPAAGTQPLGKYGQGGYMGDPLGTGMGTVPTVDVTDQLSYEMRYPLRVDPTDQGMVNVQSVRSAAPSWGVPNESGEVERISDTQVRDIARHAGMIFDVPVDFSAIDAPSRPTDVLPGKFLGTQDIAANLKDSIASTAINPTKGNLQDVINNAVFQDLRDSVRMDDLSKQQAFDIAIQSPNVVWDKDSLTAASSILEDYPAFVSKKTDIGKTRKDALTAMLPELTTQVDTFALPEFTTADQALDARTKAMVDQDMAIALGNLMESPPGYIDPIFTTSIQETVPLPPAAPAVPYMDQILGEGLTRRQVMAEKAASASARRVQAAAEQAAEAAEVQASIDRAIQRASMGQIDLTTREHPGMGGDVRQVGGVSPSMGADYSAGLNLEAVRRAQAASALAQMQASMGVDPVDVAAERAIGAAGMGGQVAGFHPGMG